MKVSAGKVVVQQGAAQVNDCVDPGWAQAMLHFLPHIVTIHKYLQHTQYSSGYYLYAEAIDNNLHYPICLCLSKYTVYVKQCTLKGPWHLHTVLSGSHKRAAFFPVLELQLLMLKSTAWETWKDIDLLLLLEYGSGSCHCFTVTTTRD